MGKTYHLKQVTFTGVDNWTDVSRMKAIQKKYPWTEFGILVSKNNTASEEVNRYPGIDKIREVLESVEEDYQSISMHFCGEAARKAALSDNPMYILSALGNAQDVKELMKFRVRRVQLNLTKMAGAIKPVDKQNYKDRPVYWNIIVPLKLETEMYFYSMRESYIHAWQGNFGKIMQGFQDNSGGRGIRESKWVAPMLSFFGYAGGISEENVLEVLDEIEVARKKLPRDYFYWIDMESSLRDENDHFDLDIVERICEKLDPIIKYIDLRKECWYVRK